NTPSCQGILPESAYVNAPIWGLDAGVSELKLLSKLQRQQEKQNHEPVRQDQQENLPQDQRDFMLKERWLIWMPRFGLGNSLRAYTSAFVFALLSGRRLLRWHGGNHKQVLDRLCHAFYCGIDELHYIGDIGKHAKLMDARRLEMHGLDYSPNVVAVYSGAFFDRLWRTDSQLNQCVSDAFACTSLWCIRSKVLSLLLGKGPRPGMQEVVDRDLRVVPPLVPRAGGVEAVGMKEAGVDGGEVEGGKVEGGKVEGGKVEGGKVEGGKVEGGKVEGGKVEGGKVEGGKVEGGKVEPQMVKKGEGLRLQFDVALHIRGHAINVEGVYCANKDRKCREKAQRGEQIREHAYMRPRQWRCIARLMQFLRIKKAAAGGFTNATAAADGSASATGHTVGIFDSKVSHAAVNTAAESGKEHPRGGAKLHQLFTCQNLVGTI
ncbi:unnamed protein product, partial [Closterium sp. Yama58-4]